MPTLRNKSGYHACHEKIELGTLGRKRESHPLELFACKTGEGRADQGALQRLLSQDSHEQNEVLEREETSVIEQCTLALKSMTRYLAQSAIGAHSCVAGHSVVSALLDSDRYQKLFITYPVETAETPLTIIPLILEEFALDLIVHSQCGFSDRDRHQCPDIIVTYLERTMQDDRFVLSFSTYHPQSFRNALSDQRYPQEFLLIENSCIDVHVIVSIEASRVKVETVAPAIY
uniref:Uncharacterized protein n=1 Tax=Pristionchus pacificus TaxID=54126 RepID=A0A2A6B6T8_PRIPA|eukprot:PDM61587.1 hypothetical protein PRIPAC_51029 [Pristionchus pacificus]